MKRIPLLSAVALAGLLAAAACGPKSPEAKLARLEKQRDALSAEIGRLKSATDDPNGGGAGPEVPLAAVRLETVSPSEFRHFLTVQGSVESDANILVPPLSPGQVKKIHVRAGDAVEQGRLLVELDASVLESGIAELKQSLDLATLIYERRQRLWDKKIGSEIEYLQAKNAKEGLEKKLLTLEEQLKMTRITAPISGTVDQVLVKEGEMAPAGLGAVRIVQLSKLKVTAVLAENYAGRVRRGDRVRISIPGAGFDLERPIDAVSQVIDPKNRTFQIEIKLSAGSNGLKPNMLAVLTINDYSNPAALTVPQGVIQDSGSERFLFVAAREGDRWIARKRAVRMGIAFDGRVEILDGLSAGERIVTAGFQRIGDGQAVAVEGSRP